MNGYTAGTALGSAEITLSRWNYGEKEDKYGLLLSFDRKLTRDSTNQPDSQSESEVPPSSSGKIPMYAGWFHTFWSTDAAAAPIIHFGGPLTPKLLRSKEFVIGSGRQRLSIAFINPGSAPGAKSRLSINALPRDVIPKVEITWPAGHNGKSQQTSHSLTERCCYWEFYTREIEVPDGVGVGMAQISIQFPDFDFPVELTSTRIEVSVIEASSKAVD